MNIAQKPWYKRPQNIIAIIGVIATITFPAVNYFLKEKKEITISYVPSQPLINNLDQANTKVYFLIDSIKTTSISKVTIKIKNTGDLPLTKSDFADGPIKINFEFFMGGSILKVSETKNANQQSSIMSFANTNNISFVAYIPSLLNKGDEVILDIYLNENPLIEKIYCIGKIFNGTIVGPLQDEETNFGFRTLVLSINSYFHFSFLTYCFTFLLLIFSSQNIELSITSLKQNPSRFSLLKFGGVITSIIFSLFCFALLIGILIYTS